jgi:hypothetical protein
MAKAKVKRRPKPKPAPKLIGTCENCVYWDEIAGHPREAIRGYCRRHSPTYHGREIRLQSVWPETDIGDFCGDFASIPEGTFLNP